MGVYLPCKGCCQSPRQCDLTEVTPIKCRSLNTNYRGVASPRALGPWVIDLIPLFAYLTKLNRTTVCHVLDKIFPVPRLTRVQVLNLMPSSLQIFTQSAAESPSASLLPILYSRCRQYNIHGKDPLFYIRSALHIS